MRIVTSQPASVRTDFPAEQAWCEAMKMAIRDGPELCRRLHLPAEYESAAGRAAHDFSVFAPLGYVRRMRPGDPHDPLLRQVLPVREELEEVSGFGNDPVGDQTATVLPGMLHKYSGRVLLVATGACAVHCRYCFRRHYPYSGSPRSASDWEPAIQHLASDQHTHEVILSGGDPLTVSDSTLSDLVARLEQITHLRRLRIHTRLPVVIPERVTRSLVELLVSTRLTTIVVVHCNHPAEIDDEVAGSFCRFVDHGIPLLNQTVLLRGINDCLSTLKALSSRLVDLRVMPYYLHQLDRVRGGAHFEVPVARGRELVAQLRKCLPGYAVPRYVCEVPGGPSKEVLE